MNAHRDPDRIDRRYDSANQAYSLIDGPGRCRMWKTATAVWAAVIRCHGDATTAYDVPTPDKAKTWCEARLAALRTNT